jgi:hypothetical protein
VAYPEKAFYGKLEGIEDVACRHIFMPLIGEDFFELVFVKKS